MRSDFIPKDTLSLLLTALMPENRRVMELAMATGLRIGDCLSIRTDVLRVKNRFSVKEQKTGKNRRIYVPEKLRKELLLNAGKVWVFEGRLDPEKHRTRAAVWKDLKRVAKLYRIQGEKIKANVSPHTARKVFAVEKFRSTGDLKKIQKLLNHDDVAVTLLYAMADKLCKR